MSNKPTYTELKWLDDADPYGAETTSDLENYTQDIYHNIGQARGSNPDNPDAGAGIDTILSSSKTTIEVRDLLVAEVNLDPRTVTATATVTQASDGSMVADLKASSTAGELARKFTIGNSNT